MTYFNILVFMLVLSGFVLVAFSFIARAKKEPARFTTQNNQEDGPIEPEIVLPPTWDERQIIGTIRRYKDQPSALSYYFSALHERFILRQDDRTAQTRTQFLRATLEQLKSAKEHLNLQKEVKVAIDDLRFHELDRDIRRRKLELEKQALENKQKKQQELDDLTHEYERLEINLRIVKTKKYIADLDREPEPPPKREPTAEDIRRKNKRRCEKDLERVEHEEGEAIFKLSEGKPFQELSENKQAEVIRIRHMYGHAKEQIREELKKYL